MDVIYFLKQYRKIINIYIGKGKLIFQKIDL